MGWVRSGGSYCSASEGVCRFGLGSAAQAEGVEVRWSNGRVEPLGTVKLRKRHEDGAKVPHR